MMGEGPPPGAEGARICSFTLRLDLRWEFPEGYEGEQDG